MYTHKIKQISTKDKQIYKTKNIFSSVHSYVSFLTNESVKNNGTFGSWKEGAVVEVISIDGFMGLRTTMEIKLQVGLQERLQIR